MIIRIRRILESADNLLTLIVIVVGLCAIVDEFFHPSSMMIDWIMSILYVITILSLPRGKRYAAWIIIAIACIDEFLPSVHGVDQTCGLGLSVFLLAYWSPRWSDAIAGVLISFSVCCDTYFFPYDADLIFPNGVIGVMLSYGIVYCMGFVVYRRRQIEESKEFRQRCDLIHRNVMLASKIHNAVSGNLARILIVTQNIVSLDNGRYKEEMECIQNDANQALYDVHEIIDHLDGYGECEEKIQYMDILESVMSSGDEKLKKLGFNAVSSLSGFYNGLMNEYCDLSLDVLHEVYSNIETHAICSSLQCSIELSIIDDCFLLKQTNICPYGKEARRNLPVSGKGLKLLARRVHDSGGILRWGRENGVWSLFCELSLSR